VSAGTNPDSSVICDWPLPRVAVTRFIVGLYHAQACAVADATDAEVLEVMQRDNPAGTERGWTSVVREGENGPVLCAETPGRIHLLVSC
jgi:hypothetical protein